MERARLESAAANYVALRGLLMIPTGIMMAVAAMSNVGWGPFRQIWVFWAAAAVSVAAALLILRHYNGTYGRITPSTRTRVKAGIAAVVIAALTFGWLQTSWSLDLPVSGSAALFAMIIVIQYAASGARLQPHQLIVSGVLLMAGLLPIWGDITRDNRLNLGMLLGGVAFVVIGILDHAALKRAFAPATDLHHGNADVDA